MDKYYDILLLYALELSFFPVCGSTCDNRVKSMGYMISGPLKLLFLVYIEKKGDIRSTVAQR